MSTIFLIALLVTVGLVVADQGRTQLDRRTLVTNLKDLRPKVNRVRARKCLPPRTIHHPARSLPTRKVVFALRFWRGRLVRARARDSRCLGKQLWAWFHTSGAACVKSHEGAWTSNTGNGYYGGFQADLAFQAAYGPEYLARFGTANNWPPVSQIHMAYRGWQARGWQPWPNTARMCGLI